MLLAKLTYSRRQFSPSGQCIRAVHTHLPPPAVFPRKARKLYNRTSYIGVNPFFCGKCVFYGISGHIQARP